MARFLLRSSSLGLELHVFFIFRVVHLHVPMLLIESNANHFHILFSSCFLLPSSCSARFTCLAVRLLLSPFALAFLRPFSRSARFTRLAHPPRPVFRGQPFLHHPCFPVKDIPALTFFQEQETTRERAPERARFLVAVQIWLFTFPPPLYSVKMCLIHTSKSV